MQKLVVSLVLVGLVGCNLIFPPDSADPPSVAEVTPAPGATGVAVGAAVKVDLELPGGDLDVTSADGGSVRLVNAGTGAVVPADVMVFNDADALTLRPTGELDYATEYRFSITPTVEDENGRAFEAFGSTFTTVPENVPSVIRARPADGEYGVPLNTPIATDLNGNVDKSTLLAADAVYLSVVATGERVPGNPGSTGAGDSISFGPDEPLEPGTEYAFTVTSSLRDADGQAFAPFVSTFTTGNTSGGCTDDCYIAVVPQPSAADERHSSLAFGPDGDLYATTIIGEIRRYPVGSGGTLGSPQTITSLIQAEGGPRLTVGLAFDPASTASNPIVWVTHTFIDLDGFDGDVDAGINEPWSGKLTRLSGPNLENVEDVVIGLPRSNKDHVTNSVAFNPAEPGVVYFVQGSNTAMGAPDPAWGFQEERVLSGAVLRLDTALLGSTPLNAQTEDGGTYNPFAPGAPLTVYASGTRNSYDLVWHSNGNLYVPANGSAAGGIVPRYNPIPGTCENRPDGGYGGPVLDSPSDVPDAEYRSDRTDGWVIARQTLNDYLFKIEEGGYYGTPNPKRCEWILNGGGVGFPGYPSTDVDAYPDSVEPDPNYRGPAGDFGQNISPNGSIEYTGSTFGNLQGKLLVTRYSLGNDVVAVSLDSEGNMDGEPTPVVPSGSFIDPIEIAEDPNTGYLYVSDYDQLSGEAATRAGIFLLRPR